MHVEQIGGIKQPCKRTNMRIVQMIPALMELRLKSKICAISRHWHRSPSQGTDLPKPSFYRPDFSTDRPDDKSLSTVARHSDAQFRVTWIPVFPDRAQAAIARLSCL